jgi:ethanolamine transporter
MQVLTAVILVFSMLGALDLIFNNKFGLGKEFEKGFHLFGSMALSMIGMIVIAPLIADVLRPVFDFTSNVLHIDASILPASLFANDMGGASLAVEVASDPLIGRYNALVVSSMMGCTISFTIPVALGMVEKEHHRELLLGMLCGIATIPVGCFVSGLLCGIPPLPLLVNLLPLVCFSALIAFGLIRFPSACVKIFSVIGYAIKVCIIVGLSLGIIRFLTGYEPLPGLDTLEEGARICLNASIVMTGAFPFMYVISKLLSKPIRKVSGRIGINEVAAVGFISSLATSLPTFGSMKQMDNKGILLNAAWAISAAFTLAGHLAFTMAFDSGYIAPMIVGKLVSGACAVILAAILYASMQKKTRKEPV